VLESKNDLIPGKGVLDLEIEPSLDFFKRFPSRFPLQAIVNRSFEVAGSFRSKGDHLLNYLDVIADSLGLRFE
jgi:hypothetical protein